MTARLFPALYQNWSKIPDLLRIRLGSIESVELSEELIDIIRNNRRYAVIFIFPSSPDQTASFAA